MAAKALIGVLPDGLALPDRLTGREVLMYLGLLRGMSREVVGQRVNGPAADGGPSPARVLKTNVAVIAVPAVTLFPAGALLIAGAAGHLLWLQWLAVPAGIGWGALLGWRCGQLAQRRLERRAPEIFSRLRTPVS